MSFHIFFNLFFSFNFFFHVHSILVMLVPTTTTTTTPTTVTSCHHLATASYLPCTMGVAGVTHQVCNPHLSHHHRGHHTDPLLPAVVPRPQLLTHCGPAPPHHHACPATCCPSCPHHTADLGHCVTMVCKPLPCCTLPHPLAKPHHCSTKVPVTPSHMACYTHLTGMGERAGNYYLPSHPWCTCVCFYFSLPC
jgi:hypothetical protein